MILTTPVLITEPITGEAMGMEVDTDMDTMMMNINEVSGSDSSGLDNPLLGGEIKGWVNRFSGQRTFNSLYEDSSTNLLCPPLEGVKGEEKLIQSTKVS